jgi:hypothetical protein
LQYYGGNYMSKKIVLTIRVPEDLKNKIEKTAFLQVPLINLLFMLLLKVSQKWKYLDSFIIKLEINQKKKLKMTF